MAIFQQQQQQNIDITEMHINTPFYSILFIKYRFKSELLFIWMLDCRESNDSAVFSAEKNGGRKRKI